MAQVKSSGNLVSIPALVGAAVCLFLIRSGFLAFFFLVPLGFIGFGWGYKTLWSGLIYALLGNIFLTLGIGIIIKAPPGNIAWDILFFTAMTVAFTWIILPPAEYGARIPGVYRLAAGSSVCALIFAIVFSRVTSSQFFLEDIKSQLELIASIYRGSNPGGTEGQFLESVNIIAVIDVLKNIMIRGGALFSSIFLLFSSRQISVFLVRIFSGKLRPGFSRSNVFMGFHVEQKIIWLFIFSLILLTISSVFRLNTLGIIFWNVITFCCMMYLAQGFGILIFLLARPNVPHFMRFALPVLFIFLLFSPVINAVLFGIIIILGIAENWVSFRRPVNGSPSTPGV